MNIDIFHPLSTFCTIAITLAIFLIGLKLAKWFTNRALKKEDLEVNIYCRDMYYDIYKHYVNEMWNINRWLSNYKHSASMTERAMNKIEALENAAEHYKQLWELNEKLIEKHA